MQTPKSRNGSSEAPQKRSPRSVHSKTPLKISSPQELTPKRFSPTPRASSRDTSQKSSPNVVRRLVPNASSPNVTSRAKERSPRADKQSSPQNSGPQKRASRVQELESQISELRNDLKKAKDELSSTEALKNRAEEEAEETKKQLVELSSKLEESKKELLKQETTEVADAFEPQDQASSEKSIDSSSALVSALNEIKELKIQLETIAESEAAQTKNAELARADLNNLKENLTDTLSLVEDMKTQLRDSKDSEARAQELVNETLLQLETAKKTVEALRSDGLKSMEVNNSVTLELDQSRAHVNLLEELISKTRENEEQHKLLRSEIESLREALEAAELRNNEEQTRSTVEIRSAYELVEQMMSSSSQREAELEEEIKKLSLQIEELKANLMDKETELQGICEENENLVSRLDTRQSGRREYELEKELQKARIEIDNLRADLMDKETELQNISEENSILKTQESDNGEEQQTLTRLKNMREEVDKSNQRAARAAEQLNAMQASNAEMEGELRRLKVQCDQWRKAAEAAAAMLSTGDNGKFMETTGKISPPHQYDYDAEDDLLKRKNANMLKRLGISWKKQQK